MSENPFKHALTKTPLGGMSGKSVFLGLQATALAVGVGALAYNSIYTVGAGEKAIIFSRWDGVHKEVFGEGWHLRVPWLHRPQVFNVRTRPSNISSYTGTKDLQMVNLSLRVLTKPSWKYLPEIYEFLGHDYDAKVLPSIVNEVLKGVVAQFNAGQLVTEREEVSKIIRKNLAHRASEFYLELDDVSITHLTFSPEYTAAVESKQIAQQEAERAKFIVEKAQQDKRSIIIKAEGDAMSAKMISEAIAENPYFLELRRIEYARSIASLVSRSQNKVYLSSENLMFNLLSAFNPNAGAPVAASVNQK